MRRGSVAATVAVLLLGSMVAVSGRLAGYPVLPGQALRYAIAAAVLLAMARCRGPLPRPSLCDAARLALLASTGLAGFNVCLVLALRSATPAAVGVIVGGVPVVLAVVGPLLSGRRPSGALLCAACVVVWGGALVQGAGRSSLASVALAAGALICEACFSLLAAPVLPRLGPVAVSAYASAAAAVELAVLAAATGGRPRLPTLSEYLAIAYLALPVTVGAFILWYTAVGHLGVERAGLFAGLVPVSTLLTAVVVRTGRLGLAQVLGCVIAGAGVTLGLAVARRRATGDGQSPAGAAPVPRRRHPACSAVAPTASNASTAGARHR